MRIHVSDFIVIDSFKLNVNKIHIFYSTNYSIYLLDE